MCVVDNASPDDSVAMVRAEFPQVHVIANADNAGYPQANNQGLRLFGFRAPGDDAPAVPAEDLPRYALLLNPDTVLPPGALADMVAFMDAHPQAGAAGPKLVRLDGSLDKACRRSFPTPTTSLYHLLKLDRLFPHSPRFGRYDLTYLDPDVLSRVDAIVGAFMLVRREAILAAGLLDETFFMYGEDLDWAKRITGLRLGGLVQPGGDRAAHQGSSQPAQLQGARRVLPGADHLLREALPGDHAVLAGLVDPGRRRRFRRPGSAGLAAAGGRYAQSEAVPTGEAPGGAAVRRRELLFNLALALTTPA